LKFHGQIIEEGKHTITRTYRYRSTDRSFYQLTTATGDRRTERGVFGRRDYWERTSKGQVVKLRMGNKEDLNAVKAIRDERSQFERILRMVLLTRLQDGKTKVSLAAPNPVYLVKDLPYEATGILGKNRNEHRYHVLDLKRPDAARLRFFIRTTDYTVRKAIQFSKERPNRIDWYFYFGPFVKEAKLGLLLPKYFSAHIRRPVDRATKEKTCKFRGELDVELNPALNDVAMRPAGG